MALRRRYRNPRAKKNKKTLILFSWSVHLACIDSITRHGDTVPHINDEEVIMKKVKIVVLASMVALLALFSASAQTITDHSIPVPTGEATTAVAPTAASSTAPTAQTDQTGNHEFEGEETDSNGQTDDEATASAKSETENEAESEAEKPDTDNVEVEE